jgi:hydrogenase expression/formation protein HypE
LIIEEGLPMATLERVVNSMRLAADQARVSLITGDTKVVERGKADGLFINTTGIGLVEGGLEIAPSQIRLGDLVLISGDIGRHGISIMASREGLAFESEITSDTAQLATVVSSLIRADIPIHCLRDLTRGGLASALVEIAESSGCSINIVERSISVREDVRGACEILGLDVLHLASEGRLVAFVPAAAAHSALDILRLAPGGEAAAAIGEVTDAGTGRVTLRTALGTSRVVEMFSGEQLPRIC